MNENPALCKKCGGACCKRNSGIWQPTQFGETREEILAEITRLVFKKQIATVDYWEGPLDASGETAYFVRPREVGAMNSALSPSWGGVCHLLTPEGCSLPSNARPIQCQLLVPSEPVGQCTSGGVGTKKSLALEWLPYSAAIEALLRKHNK